MKPAAILAQTACGDPTPGSTLLGVSVNLGPNGMAARSSAATTFGGVTIGATSDAAGVRATL